MPHTIEYIHAFIVIGDDGEEGIPAFVGPGGMLMPMLASDRVRLEQFEGMVREWLRHGQLPNCQLIRFSTREVVEIYKEP